MGNSKGPSLDPTVKRLALAVEDHELSHTNFEGALGKNSTRLVIMWDSGWFEEVLIWVSLRGPHSKKGRLISFCTVND